MRAENLAPTGIRSPDRPAHSESLYRLSYRGPHLHLMRRLRMTSTVSVCLHGTQRSNCTFIFTGWIPQQNVAWEVIFHLQMTSPFRLTLRLLMSYIYMELLVKPEMLTSYIYGPTFGNAETVSFYLLHNVSTLNQCRLQCFSVAKRRSIYIRR